MGDTDIPPSKRFYLETIEADDWDCIPCIRTFHEEMRQKNAPEPAKTESA
jgi:hypothetical protein